MALNRQDIARSGLRLLNDVGLGGLTLRLIAGDLGVKAPALYWHVKNKQELLDRMATQMLADAVVDRVPPGGLDAWQLLEHQARTLRRTLLAYRDGARVFSGTYLDNLSLLGPCPLWSLIDAELASRVAFTVHSFVIGFTIEEQAVRPGERDQHHGPADAIFRDVEAGFSDGLAMALAGARQWVETASSQVDGAVRP